MSVRPAPTCCGYCARVTDASYRCRSTCGASPTQPTHGQPLRTAGPKKMARLRQEPGPLLRHCALIGRMGPLIAGRRSQLHAWHREYFQARRRVLARTGKCRTGPWPRRQAPKAETTRPFICFPFLGLSGCAASCRGRVQSQPDHHVRALTPHRTAIAANNLLPSPS